MCVRLLGNLIKRLANKSQIEERIAKWPNLTDKKSIQEFIARNRDAGARYSKL